MKLRTARPSDRERILWITVATFGPVSIDRNLEDRLGPLASSTWAERKCHAVGHECDEPDNVLVAVDSEDVVQGYVTVRWDHETRVGSIPNVAVAPDHQGNGIGRTLLEAAIDLLRTRGAEAVRIETLEQNPIGRRLYPALGFVEVARQIHYALRLDGPRPDAAPSGGADPSPPV